MSDINIDYFTDYSTLTGTYKETVLNALKIFKGFDPDIMNYCGIVTTNNIIIGFIGIKYIQNNLYIKVYQYPNVCRLSILSLIDSSISFSQSVSKEVKCNQIIFQDVSYAHTFKLQQIISDIEIENNNYVTTSEKLLSVDMSKITLKNIILAKI